MRTGGVLGDLQPNERREIVGDLSLKGSMSLQDITQILGIIGLNRNIQRLA